MLAKSRCSFQWLVGLHPCAVWWAQPCLAVLGAAGPAGDWLLPLSPLSSSFSSDSLPWPAALFLCIQHAARPSSLLTGAVLLPSAICHSLFCPVPALPTCAFLLTSCCLPGIPADWDSITRQGHNRLGALKETPSACKDGGTQWEMVGI